MKFKIKHEIRGRIRIHMEQKRMTHEQADILLFYLQNIDGVFRADVYDRTADATIHYKGNRETIIEGLRRFRYEEVEVPNGLLETSGRAMNAEYQEKLVDKILFHYGRKFLLPYPISAAYTTIMSAKYIWKGIKTLMERRIEVPVLDATAIGVSIFRSDFSTAGSIMFLLGIGELLEEWTHKKSVDDLARTMSLNVGKVWLKTGDQTVLVSSNQIKSGDQVVVHMGNVIPFDGEVVDGEAMINQASLTGESVPVRRTTGNYVYAGTVVEEGEVTVDVKAVGGSSRYEKIAAMIEESEKLKSGLESRAEHLADKLVPYSLGGTALTYLLTRNATKALSILMVDFSCALKLAMPISVLSAIREAGMYKITVKGGKYLEAVSEATTIVFDKTGTLTHAAPRVAAVVPFGGKEENDMLALAACLEEHYPHSMAKAVVAEAENRHISHEERHSSVSYIVAHGIASSVDGEKVIIGSHHFVFEDEKCVIPAGEEEKFDSLPAEYSHLYLAAGGVLAAVICIEDPLRAEAADVVRGLRSLGFTKLVMMTGDSDRTAKSVAAAVGVDEYYSEVLPEDKANFIRREHEAGRRVIMLGDGVNDSPALSEADAGIAIRDGAAIAREVADITIGANDLYSLLTLRRLSCALMNRIHTNYRNIIGFNFMLICLGVAGILPPATSALLHNAYTLTVSLRSMTRLLPPAEIE